MALTVSGANSFNVAKHFGFHSTPSWECLEAATQTFKRGAPLVFSGGYVQEATASSEEVIGIAATDGSNDASAGTSVQRVIPIIPGMVFEGATSSALTDRATAQTDAGAIWGIAKDATNLGWYLNASESTNYKVRIIGFKDAVTTTNGRVYFVWLTVHDVDGTIAPVSGLLASDT